MPELPNINIVVIGHKDHGKSTLIGRLLYDAGAIQESKLEELRQKSRELRGVDIDFSFVLDSFEEEREGHLTIDIVHTPFKSKKYFYTIIDCPGHKEFIKNMITGASNADAGLLLVSAQEDEGIQDQTKEHVFLIKILGIKNLIVAVSKIDAVDYSKEKFERIVEKTKMLLNSVGFDASKIPFVPVSGLRGDNVFKKLDSLAWYKGSTLIETLDATVEPTKIPVDKPLRIPVQDVYEFDGKNLIIGKVETGILRKGDEIIFQPSGIKTHVKTIEMFGSKKEQAKPGDSIGFQTMNGIKEITRGCVCGHPENPPILVKEFTAQIILLSDLEIKVGDKLIFRIGASEKECEIKQIIQKIDPVNLTPIKNLPESIKSDEIGRIRISPLQPLVLEKYSNIPELGRFVIKKDRGTVAAGTVLDFIPV